MAADPVMRKLFAAPSLRSQISNRECSLRSWYKDIVKLRCEEIRDRQMCYDATSSTLMASASLAQKGEL
jgi:hypothetical protein